MIDLLVAGGGPAGLATAILGARAGLEVVVVERRHGPVDKACGEGLMPHAVALLGSLGVDAPGKPFHGITYVDGSVAPLDHDHLEPGPGAEDRGGQPGRSTASHKHIDHRSLASAAFSTPIRARSTTALSAVSTTAVTHAVCTNGSAIPSTTTAT